MMKYQDLESRPFEEGRPRLELRPRPQFSMLEQAVSKHLIGIWLLPNIQLSVDTTLIEQMKILWLDLHSRFRFLRRREISELFSSLTNLKVNFPFRPSIRPSSVGTIAPRRNPWNKPRERKVEFNLI